jgi:hypothetical protein
LSEVMFAVLFAWILLGELPRPVQLVGGLFILAGIVAVRSEQRRGPGDRSALPSALPSEDGSAVGGVPGEASSDDFAVVPHDRVELGRVDVVATKHH